MFDSKILIFQYHIFEEEKIAMNNSLVEYLGSLDDFRYTGAARKSDVIRAQNALRQKFAEEYIAYLLAFGCGSAKYIELTGLNIKRLNVVDITQFEREEQKFFPSNMYVVLDKGEEDYLVLQKSDGTVYELHGSGRIEKIADSLTDYLKYYYFLMEEVDAE